MDINKLRKEHQKHVARIAELEQQVVQHETTLRDAVTAALRAHRLDVTALERQLAEAHTQWSAQNNALSVEVTSLKDENEVLTIQLTERNRRIHALAGQVQEYPTTLGNLTQQVEELTALLAKVEGRMKRKEREEKAAILNRRAATFRGVR